MEDLMKKDLNKLMKKHKCKVGLLTYFKQHEDGDFGVAALLSDAQSKDMQTLLWHKYFYEKGTTFIADMARSKPDGKIFIIDGEGGVGI